MSTNTRQLNVSITQHFSKFIRDKVKSGRYANASEVVREALRKMEQEEITGQHYEIVDPDNVKEAVAEGFRSIERGDAIDIESDEDLRRFFDDIVERGRKRFAARKKALRG